MSEENIDFNHYYQLLKKYNIEKIFDELDIKSVSDIELKIRLFDIFSTRHGNYIRVNGKIIPGTYEEGELHPDLKMLRSTCLAKLQSKSIFYDICRYIFTLREIELNDLSLDYEEEESIFEESTLDNDKSDREENTPVRSDKILINKPISSSSNYIDKYKYLIMLLLFVFVMSLKIF